jgi:AcrR family transcriptional regulator
MAQPVKVPRTRRAEKAEQTRRRILEAATALFTEPGFAATTIEAIAERADVAVETVYSRFRNKANLLEAILGPAIAGREDVSRVLDRPEIAEIRACQDQQEQIRMLASFSRGILERTYQAHRILRTAAAVDPQAEALRRGDQAYRLRTQRAYIELLLGSGPLRPGLPPDVAADTYSALASPATYAFLVGERRWTAQQFEEWLRDCLARLLLS